MWVVKTNYQNQLLGFLLGSKDLISFYISIIVNVYVMLSRLHIEMADIFGVLF